MLNNLHYVMSLCILSLGAGAETCSEAVLNKRSSFDVVSGESVSLACVVQHCGHSFTGKWMWKNSTGVSFSTVQATAHHRLTREDVSANRTRLRLELLGVRAADEGFYGCRVQWESLEEGQGHFMFINVTAAVTSERTLLHRMLVCVAAVLCVFMVLGLVLCLRSKVTPQVLHRKLTPVTSPRPMPRPSLTYQAPLQQSTPQPPPRRQAPQRHPPPNEAPHQPQQKTEVVYADISQDALLRQQQEVKRSHQSTVYSSVRFA